MARKPTLTQKQLDALRAEYEAWNPYDPDAPSAEGIAARHGVSKNTMYVWRSRGWSLTGRDGDGPNGWKQRGGGMAVEPTADSDAVVHYLMEELITTRVQLAQAEQALADAQAEKPEKPENDKGPTEH